MRLDRRALEAAILSQVKDSIREMRGPWSPAQSGEIVRRVAERLNQMFDLPPEADQEIRRTVAEVVHSVVRELRGKGQL
jgi:hypothetical protein